MQASDLSAVDIAYKLRTGRIDAQQIIDDHLASIHISEPQLQVWEMLDEAMIRKQASHLKTELPLSGVPVGIKDIIDCADIPCRWGSALFQSRIPDKDAQVIAQLKAAGALILGKTRTTEFAYLQYCQTRNPQNFAYSPGGSSSGSAAGVAAGHMPVALGSQTGGSVIRPAAYCGVFGFKPSFERISRKGVLQTSQSLDHLGVFARYLEDVALVCDVLFSSEHKGLLSASLQASHTSPQFIWDQNLLADQIETYAYQPIHQLAAKTDFPLQTEALDSVIQHFNAVHSVIYDVEYAQNIAPLIQSSPSAASKYTQETVERGSKISASDYDVALAERAKAQAFFTAKLGKTHFLLLPSATSQAPLFEAGTGNPACSKFTSLCGLPAITVPRLQGIHLNGPDGLPLGVQIVGAFGNDAGVIAAAKWLAEYCAAN